MNSCLITGTFDPMTKGHMDIIARSAKVFDKVYVGVLMNGQKQTMFNINQRLLIAKKSVEDFNNVEVVSFEGLAIDLAWALKVKTIVRGIRGAGDFDYEKNMALVNYEIGNDIETMFLVSRYPHISSSVVRELISLNGDYGRFLTDNQKKEIINILKK